MPALVAGIHVFLSASSKDVDGRDKPGHDGVGICGRRTYGIFFTTLVSRLNTRAAFPPRMLRLAVSSRNGRS